MKKNHFSRNYMNNNKGQALLEYALIILLVGIAAIFATAALRDSLRATFATYITQRQEDVPDLPFTGGEFEAGPPPASPPGPENTAPIAGISTDPTLPIVDLGEAITFKSVSSDHDGDSIVSHSWDLLGDGTVIKTGIEVTHIYSTTDPSAVWFPRLTVTDSNGASSSATVSVGVNNGEIPNLPPTAVMKVDIISGPAPLTVTFDGTESEDLDKDPDVSDPENGIYKYQWHFGDIVLLGAGATNEHVYNTPGEYEAWLTVTDEGGQTAESGRITIKVETPNTLPTVSIEASSTKQLTGNEIAFTASIVDPDGPATRYQWEFGDDSTIGPFSVTDSVLNVVHTYHAPSAPFTVKLTVWDNAEKPVEETIDISITAKAACDSPRIREQLWTGVGGSSIGDLTGLAGFSDYPNQITPLDNLQRDSLGSDYGTRYVGFIQPPEDGQYTFYIASDNSSELYLSSNDEPGNKVRIASVSSATAAQQWDADPSQKSAVVSLVAGRNYYFEVLHKKGGSGGHMAVGWEKPGPSPIEVITGDYLCFDNDLIPTPTPLITGVCSDFEAESATLGGGVSEQNNNPGYSGSGFADYPSSSDNEGSIYVEWNVNVATAGNYNLGFRYALGSSTARPLQLQVNGVEAHNALPFDDTGGWSTWIPLYWTAPLNAGDNTIRLTALNNQGPNVDCLSFQQLP